MPILNITDLAGNSCTVNINNDQINTETTLDFVKDQVRAEVGIKNFNLFIPSQQETPINSDQNIRDIINQAHANNDPKDLILLSTEDRDLDNELFNQCKKHDKSITATRVIVEACANVLKMIMMEILH